jgi:hypothetical protein
MAERHFRLALDLLRFQTSYQCSLRHHCLDRQVLLAQCPSRGACKTELLTSSLFDSLRKLWAASVAVITPEAATSCRSGQVTLTVTANARIVESRLLAISAGISGIGFYAEVVVFAEKAEGA